MSTGGKETTTKQNPKSACTSLLQFGDSLRKRKTIFLFQLCRTWEVLKCSVLEQTKGDFQKFQSKGTTKPVYFPKEYFVKYVKILPRK